MRTAAGGLDKTVSRQKYARQKRRERTRKGPLALAPKLRKRPRRAEQREREDSEESTFHYAKDPEQNIETLLDPTATMFSNLTTPLLHLS